MGLQTVHTSSHSTNATKNIIELHRILNFESLKSLLKDARCEASVSEPPQGSTVLLA
jgi:hypothetical protein